MPPLHANILQANDPHDDRLLREVCPPDWVNPVPADRYDLVVIGAGTAGLVTAAGAAGLGARVALIERSLMGGDCLNVGCVPSKLLLRSAKAAHAIRSADRFGIGPNEPHVDFSCVMERLRRVRADIAPHDSAQRFRELGVDVFLGEATFASRESVRVGELTLQFRKAAICTGARATLPALPGLAEVGALTNETLFRLTNLPPRLGVIGGGPIGCEMAQAFARLGSRVQLFQRSDRLLADDEPEASALVRASLEKDGVEVHIGAVIERIESTGSWKAIIAKRGLEAITRECDEILVAVGRTPNIKGLNLSQAGVEVNPRGVQVDDHLRTSNPRIFAAGDVSSPFKFTHAADFQARIVIRNALFFGRAKASRLLIPHCTYTSPEVAHVGLSVAEAREKGIAITTFRQPLTGVDRAILDDGTGGYVAVHTRPGTDRILGATIVGEHAGDLISELTVAIQHGIGLKKLAETIHPYPTLADAIRKVGDQYNKTRLTPWTRTLLQWVLAVGR